MDEQELRAWVGRTEARDDVVAASPLARLAALLDDPAAGADAPAIHPLWHWLHVLDAAPQRELGPDGHPARGGFLPPVALPRRAYAGFRLRRSADPALGTGVRRESTVLDVVEKQGRGGPLVLVTVVHRVSDGAGRELLVEEQDIAYTERRRSPRAAPASDASPGTGKRGNGPQAVPSAPLECEVRADPTLLFRFSALTFNGHRIHYDAPYATEVEGYPGLVVHGPLIALLLCELARAAMPEAALRSLQFRARRPVFDGDLLHLRGWPSDDGEVALSAVRADGTVAAEATASFAHSDHRDAH